MIYVGSLTRDIAIRGLLLIVGVFVVTTVFGTPGAASPYLICGETTTTTSTTEFWVEVCHMSNDYLNSTTNVFITAENRGTDTGTLSLAVYLNDTPVNATAITVAQNETAEIRIPTPPLTSLGHHSIRVNDFTNISEHERFGRIYVGRGTYDLNNSGVLETPEVVLATQDWAKGRISSSYLLQLNDAWANRTPI